MAEKIETVRLRNIKSGAVVSVAAEKAARMGSEWEPAAATKSADKKAPASKSDS